MLERVIDKAVAAAEGLVSCIVGFQRRVAACIGRRAGGPGGSRQNQETRAL